MPIPFLIAGAVAAAAAVAAAVALSDDDKPSSSSDDTEEQARLRQEAAEKERKKRQREQKRLAATEDFQKEARLFGQNLAYALDNDLLDASFSDNFSPDFDLRNGSLNFSQRNASLRDSHLFAAIHSLETILPDDSKRQSTIDNLVTFSELYKPDFVLGAVLEKKQQQIASIESNVQMLHTLKAQLRQLSRDAASLQA